MIILRWSLEKQKLPVDDQDKESPLCDWIVLTRTLENEKITVSIPSETNEGKCQILVVFLTFQDEDEDEDEEDEEDDNIDWIRFATKEHVSQPGLLYSLRRGLSQPE